MFVSFLAPQCLKIERFDVSRVSRYLATLSCRFHVNNLGDHQGSAASSPSQTLDYTIVQLKKSINIVIKWGRIV